MLMVPAGVVLCMRRRLKLDVLAVVEDDTLRRANDVEHYHAAATRLKNASQFRRRFSR